MSDLKAEVEDAFQIAIDQVSAKYLIDLLNPDGDEDHKLALAELERRAKIFDVTYGYFYDLSRLYGEQRVLLKKKMR